MSVSNSSKFSIKEKADAARLKLIPNKSANRYKKELGTFKQWEQTNEATGITEDVMLAYVSELITFYVLIIQMMIN